MPESKRKAGGALGGLAGLVGLSAVAGVLITATVTPAIAVTSAAASSAITLFDNLPSVLEISDLMEPTTLYAKDPATGEYAEMTSFYDQNRSPVTWDAVAPVMYDAILSSEDPRFYEHGGIDLFGTTRAVLSNLQGDGDVQGGSSVSQQYVKNILIQKCEWNATDEQQKQDCFVEATNSSGTEGIQRKLQEMRYAISLEQQYSKNDILLGYLNIANFGGITYGIDAAARYYFGVPASQLSLAQASTLAGVVQNPNTYRIDMPEGSTSDEAGAPLNGAFDGYALTKQRQTYVLDRMLEDGKITQEQHDTAVAEPITPVITEPTKGCAASTAPYFCQYVVSVIKNDPAFGETPDDRQIALRRGGLKVYTTLDWNLQNSAGGTMAYYAPSSLEGMNFGAASVNVEAATGRVLSITQNTKFSEDAGLAADPNYSSLVYAGNQQFGDSNGFPAGSTFKIFTLVDWLEQGHSVNEVVNGVNRAFPRMTNSCTGDWVNTSGTRIGNFGGAGGFVGTPMRFTSVSLNSGFLAMAAQLDLCDIAKVAAKMGVTLGDGSPIPMAVANEVIGSDNVSPLAMAGAYATVANNGIYCQPQAIDRVTNAAGEELPKPQRTCTQVISPEVAATAAYALQGVMDGGTGAGANPYDGTELIGKTGTHEAWQTWMIESSTAVATAVWVGNSIGENSVFDRSANGRQVSNLRYSIARDIQARADELYPGGRFPDPASNLLRTVMKDLPNVVGMSVDQAQQTLEAAGFQVSVGDPVDSDAATNIVAAQNPGGGSAPGGSVITINPSNGLGVRTPVPAVAGLKLEDARAAVSAAGLSPAAGACTVDPALGEGNARATGTDPAAGTPVRLGSAVAIGYAKKTCP